MNGLRHQAPLIGVLAMQGAFREHVRALAVCGASTREVRLPADLDGIDALVIPGGESTTIRKLLESSGLTDPVRNALARGLPALGTCAGLIVLATAAADGAPNAFGLLDVTVKRNGFGPQIASFEAPVSMALEGGQLHTMNGVFIRAPRITSVSSSVQVIGHVSVDGGAPEPVAVCQGSIVGCTFHPELGDDLTLHRWFVSRVADATGYGPAPMASGRRDVSGGT